MTNRFFTKLLASLSLLACTSVFAAPLVVDVTGVQSYGAAGDPGNTVLTFNVGANSTVDSIAWSVGLTAYDPSWLSEITLFFSPSDQVGGVYLTPGFGDDTPGTAAYAGFGDLVAANLDFNVGADGILRLEFLDSFDDFPGAADGMWDAGTVTFGITETAAGVPEPATGALIAAGLAMMGYASRRKRRQ